MAAKKVNFRLAKLRPTTFGVVATGSVRTLASNVKVLPKCDLISLPAIEYWRIDINDAPSKSAEMRTIALVRCSLKNRKRARAPTAIRVPGYNQLCTSAPAHVAPPNASARLSTTREVLS